MQQKVECNTTVIVVQPKPNTYAVCFAIDIGHSLDLSIAFLDGPLLDAKSIDL
jgi:hypothetical protein